VGRRSRAREKLNAPRAPNSEYPDEHGGVLTLRGSFTPRARLEYAQTASGEASGPAATREDAWQRAVELLFERLAVSWETDGVRVARQRDLLERLRGASPQQRAWVRDRLREHCAEHFPDVKAP
jgi:hypothetical protein